MKKVYLFFGLALAFFIAHLRQVCFSLPAGSIVYTPSGAVSIEELRQGSPVTSFNAVDGSVPEAIIQELQQLQEVEILEIKTGHGLFFTGPSQEVYEASQKKFVRADALKINNRLFSVKHGEIVCLEIISHPLPTTCYKFSLSGPDLFFASDLGILVHNVAAAASLLPALIESFSGVAIIACAYIQGKTEFFNNLTLGKNQAFKNIDMFADQYRKNPPTNAKQNVSFIASPPLIAGIKPDPQIYHHLRLYPQLYSPIIISAEMDSSGDVICSLWTVHIDSCDEKTNWYSKHIIGRERVARNHATVKVFVQEEDKQQLEVIRSYIKTVPSKVISELFKSTVGITQELERIKKIGCFEKPFYGIAFGIHALQRMAQWGIAPSQILHITKYGKCIAARHPERLIMYDQPLDLIVVTEKQSKKILAIGHYKTDYQYLNEATPEQVEKEKESKQPPQAVPESEEDDFDLANDAKKEHVLQDKHNWHKLVPDPKNNNNWNKIVALMRRVIKEGNDEVWKKIKKEEVIYKSLATIDGQVLEVTYRIIDGVRRLSSAWIQ